MSNIRVLIRDAPTMLRDILEQVISNEHDMEVVPEPVVPIQTLLDRPLSPDVVIVGAGDFDPAERARGLLARWPGTHVLMITARGHRVLRYELLPRRIDLGEMSPDQLVRAIRSAARPERES
jgi:DNA-binding NarL/FixJ family response regulator